jgi:tetratricopeptide (TPR) repeat protein
MKGLILTHMGKREEGLELVKKGLRLDLTSHIAWHVFGLIQKGEKNYEEALKSYTQALRFDKVSPNQTPWPRFASVSAPPGAAVLICLPAISQSYGAGFSLSPVSNPESKSANLILRITFYFNQDNLNILRDAAHLQTQLRIYDGLVDTRFLLLKLRPNLRQNWIGLALAYHLNGNLAEAKNVLEQYERSLKVCHTMALPSFLIFIFHVLFVSERARL